MFLKILKWIYLILSAISFVIVVCFFAFLGYAYVAKDEVRSLVNDFEEYRAYQKNNEIFEVLEYHDDANVVQSYSMTSNNSTFSKGDSKIKIKTKNGFAYLKVSHIYFIEAGDDYHRLITIHNKEIKLNKRETPLSKLAENLNELSCFYHTKSFIINCHYIELIERNENSKSKRTNIVLETGEEIPLPEIHVKNLFKTLDELHNTK